jgi:hypothetical protein
LLRDAFDPFPDQIDFVPGRLDPGLRLFPERVQHPDIFIELYGVHRPVRITRWRTAISNTPAPMPFKGLAMSAFSPCAAMRNANMTRSCTCDPPHQ